MGFFPYFYHRVVVSDMVNKKKLESRTYGDFPLFLSPSYGKNPMVAKGEKWTKLCQFFKKSKIIRVQNRKSYGTKRGKMNQVMAFFLEIKKKTEVHKSSQNPYEIIKVQKNPMDSFPYFLNQVMPFFKKVKKNKVKFIAQLGSFFPFSSHRTLDLGSGELS